MKKIFTTAAVALFMLSLASCSDDDSSSNNSSTENVLVKRAVERDGSDSVTSIYTYDGKKIKTITYDNGDVDTFTYNGNQIVKATFMTEGELWLTDTYAYNSNGQVSEHTTTDTFNVTYQKTTFVYNNDSTISTKVYEGITEAASELTGTGVLLVKNGNGTTYTYTATGETTPEITFFTFDDKKNPYKNITGFAAIELVTLEGHSPENNILMHSTPEGVTKYTYVYNDAGYPTSSVETDGDNDSYTTDFYYE